jgi:conjugal transfer pilus assembly protein TraD
MPYPVENLFRKPYELIPATASLVAAPTAFAFRELLQLSPAAAFAFALGCLAHSGWRINQAKKIIQFQRNLRRLPQYTLTADEIPWSDKELFLGLGFRWDQRHTQRLFTARQPENAHLRARNRLYDRARDWERQHPGHWLTKQLRRETWWNPVEPLPPVGGDPAIHGVEPEEMEQWMDLGERVGHTLVLGTTRVGKTRLAEMFIAQDIRRGDVTIVFDPKGDVTLLRRMYAEAVRAGRQEQFYFFHLGYPGISARYSPIGTYAQITEVATRVANQLPGEGQSAAFKEFVWRFVNVIAKTMEALGIKPTYELLYRHATNIDSLAQRYFELWLDKEHAEWRDELAIKGASKEVASQAQKTGRSIVALSILALVRENAWHDPIADALGSVLTNDRSYFEKLVSSLYPLLEKLTTGRINELLSPDMANPDDRRPVFDWDKIISQGGIIYVGLDSLSNHEVAAAVGNAMFADLTSTAGRLYKFGAGYGQSGSFAKRKISVHADEFNELIGDEFVPMLNKAGGAGYQVTVYTQTWSDVEAKIGSKAKADQIGGNLNTLIMLRVKNTETAEILTDQLPMVEVLSHMLVSGSTDGSHADDLIHFTASAEDRFTKREIPMIQPADLVQLPKGQAFALVEGGQLIKLRLALPSEEHDALMPPDLETVAADMQRKYSRYLADLGEDGDGEDDLTASARPWEQVTTAGRGSDYRAN